MKIILVAPYFYPHKGGLEQFCWEVARRISKLNHEVTVITSKLGDDKTLENTSGFKVARLESWNLLNGRWPLPKFSRKNYSILKQIYKKNPDVTINNTRFFPICFMTAKFSKKFRVKVIHIEHGTCYPQMESKFKSFLAKFYDRTFGRWTIALANQTIGISGAAAEFAKNLGAENPEVIHNSVDTDFFRPRIDSQSTSQITFVGRLIEAKGIQDLIQVFKAIPNKNLILNITGKGFYDVALKEMAKSDARIKFLGEKDQAGIREILEASDIFVNPSYSEGLPTSVLEAGAMGLAVIATDVGGTGEIIDDGKNGFLFKPKDQKTLKEKLSYLINNQEEREQMGRALRQKIENKFDWNGNIDKLIAVIK